MFSQYTTYLANRLCGGSSRKLIAGWWYSILGVTITITLVSLTMIGNYSNPNNNNNYYNTALVQQCVIAVWCAFLLCCFCIGGTMIMRKFHNSIAVGFFMGVTVSSCQFFIAMAFIYFHYRHLQILDNRNSNNGGNGSAKEVTLFACLSIVQAILLGTFAIILAAHRTEISVDSTGSNSNEVFGNNEQQQHPDNNEDNDDDFNNSINNSRQQQRPSGGELYQPPVALRSSHIVRT